MLLRSLVLAFLLPVGAAAQWTDVKQLGLGGEAFVAPDGKGNVYVTSHQPCQLLISRDYGDTFGDPFKFRNALGDLHVFTWGEGRVHVTYMLGAAEGLKSWYSTDAGKTLTEGEPHMGPYDREWIAVNPKTNEVYLNYSDGYIGGPKSKGVYLAASTDGGKTFVRRSRIDAEPEGKYAVDPYLVNNPNGRLYSAWAVTSDYDTIESYAFAMSDDGGKTWQNRQMLAKTSKNLGDTQERWMLGGILAVGEDTVIAYYQDYAAITSEGKEARPLLTFYRISTDAGKTFGEAQSLMPLTEVRASLKSYAAGRKSTKNYPMYIQSLPWMAADPSGNVHAVLQDNRIGQDFLDGDALNLWQVRYLRMNSGKTAFEPSEQVSKPYIAKRPPLDFMACSADATRLYIVWTESNNPAADWEFSGRLMLARKKF